MMDACENTLLDNSKAKKTKKSTASGSKVDPYRQAYLAYSNAKKLYYLVDPAALSIKKEILRGWSKMMGSEAYEIETPILLPKKVLDLSGHRDKFGKEELFDLENQSLSLRPETVQSIFANYSTLRRDLKGEPLKIWSCGRSFRCEQSTRLGSFRKNEFEQLECVVLSRKDLSFAEESIPLLCDFFKTIKIVEADRCTSKIYSEAPKNLEAHALYFLQLDQKTRPHYSQRTIDIFYRTGEGKDIEIGCINYRGNNDLYTFSDKERSFYRVYQISLGLDRLLQCICLSKASCAASDRDQQL